VCLGARGDLCRFCSERAVCPGTAYVTSFIDPRPRATVGHGQQATRCDTGSVATSSRTAMWNVCHICEVTENKINYCYLLSVAGDGFKRWNMSIFLLFNHERNIYTLEQRWLSAILDEKHRIFLRFSQIKTKQTAAPDLLKGK
jgi:hypothetical protein